jgi:hypothetical protein
MTVCDTAARDSSHSERSEKRRVAAEILRCAQDDSIFQGVAESRTVM